MLANEYRNFQIRIVQDTVNPTAVGQRRNITSHTAGASPVYTVPAWTVTPSANAVFVIENNGDRILYWGSAQQQHLHLQHHGEHLGHDHVRRALRGACCRVDQLPVVLHPSGRRRSCRATVTCMSSVAAAGAVMDLFDIAGGATGAWTAAIVYGGSGMTFTTGTTVTPDPYTGGGRFAFINASGLQRCLKFDVKNRVLSPGVLSPLSDGHGGGRAAHVHGDVRGRRDEARLHHPPAHGGAECFEMAVQK